MKLLLHSMRYPVPRRLAVWLIWMVMGLDCLAGNFVYLHVTGNGSSTGSAWDSAASPGANAQSITAGSTVSWYTDGGGLTWSVGALINGSYSVVGTFTDSGGSGPFNFTVNLNSSGQTNHQYHACFTYSNPSTVSQRYHLNVWTNGVLRGSTPYQLAGGASSTICITNVGQFIYQMLMDSGFGEGAIVAGGSGTDDGTTGSTPGLGDTGRTVSPATNAPVNRTTTPTPTGDSTSDVVKAINNLMVQESDATDLLDADLLDIEDSLTGSDLGIALPGLWNTNPPLGGNIVSGAYSTNLGNWVNVPSVGTSPLSITLPFASLGLDGLDLGVSMSDQVISLSPESVIPGTSIVPYAWIGMFRDFMLLILMICYVGGLFRLMKYASPA